MNWKEKYAVLKVGDKVKLIKAVPKCPACTPNTNTVNCCKQYMDTIGRIYKIEEHYEIPRKDYNVRFDKGGSCSFPKECLEKVI